MSFDFSTLVTDRTQADVNRVKQIAEKIKNGTASESELAEFNSAAMKGAYNYTDLNRVTAAMEALKAKLEGYGYAVPGYQKIEIPHPSAGGGSRLPEGYTELAWIESTGTQYIDTLYTVQTNTRIVCDFQLTSTPSATTVLFRNASYGFGWQSSGVFRSWGGSVVDFSVSATERYTVDKKPTSCTLGSTSQTTTAHAAQSLSLPLLAYKNSSGTISQYVSAKMYSCQIYEDDMLVRDFVPCKNSNGVFGLYDIANDEFYQNAGSGAFTAGEEIAPPADVPIVEEYDPYLWYEFDWPTTETMAVYIMNLSVIRAALTVMASTPRVPSDMVGLVVKEANDIEVILLDVYRQIAIMATTFIPCGEALCGGDNL